MNSASKLDNVTNGTVFFDELIEGIYTVIDQLDDREYFLFLDLAENNLLSEKQEAIIKRIYYKYLEAENG